MYTLHVLDMFDPGVVSQVEGVNINRPYNALTLTHDLYQRFGDLIIYFEPVSIAAVPHTYIILQTTSYSSFLFTTPNRGRCPDSLLTVGT